MKQILSILFAAFVGASALHGQNLAPFFFAGGADKSFDLMSPNSTYGAAAHLKFLRLYLYGSYSISPSTQNKYQLIPAGNSQGMKIGYMKGRREGEKTTGIGFVFGYANENYNKKLSVDYKEQPVDEFGNKMDIDFTVLRVNSQIYSAGFNVLMHEVKENQYLEAMADEYDLEKIGEKHRRSFTTVTMEFLYAPKIDYSRSIIYSPFANYVPTQVYITSNPKVKHFGLRFKAEYITFSGFGFQLEMGLQPGISLKTDQTNDFGFSTKAGLLYYLYYAK